MNVDFVNLKEYLEYKDTNIYIKGFLYSVIIGILLIWIIIFLSLKKKDLYYEDFLIVKNNEIILTIPYDYLNLIVNSQEIVIDDKAYNYNIKDLECFNNGILYYQIKIIVNNYFLDYDNIVLKYKVFIKEESFLSYLVGIVKGEYKSEKN